MQTGTTEQRNEKILFVQQQINGLQAHGAYGYEVLEALRERIKLVPVAIQERWREGAFEFVYRQQVICRFCWEDTDSVCIELFDQVEERRIVFAQIYPQGKKVEWLVIGSTINNYIRELQSSEVMSQ